jgi:opacity protein-like surface antigen
MRKFVTLALALVVLGTGATLAAATGGGGWYHGGGSSHVQYKAKQPCPVSQLSDLCNATKPGCGPDKTDGYAGASGRHVGQPPKDQNRGDCPHPPGQE